MERAQTSAGAEGGVSTISPWKEQQHGSGSIPITAPTWGRHCR